MQQRNLNLIVGGTGKTGRRVAARLATRGSEVRLASRPGFDWNDEHTWTKMLDGATAAYLTYAPDRLPPGTIVEPFLDCDDIADVATAALLDDAHAGKTYELTGPRLLDLVEVAREIPSVSGRPHRYQAVSSGEYAKLLAPHLSLNEVSFFIELFVYLLDGRSAHVTNAVEEALGRPARDFRSCARKAWAS